jgi:hypothetical protein
MPAARLEPMERSATGRRCFLAEGLFPKDPSLKFAADKTLLGSGDNVCCPKPERTLGRSA